MNFKKSQKYFFFIQAHNISYIVYYTYSSNNLTSSSTLEINKLTECEKFGFSLTTQNQIHQTPKPENICKH